MEFILKVIKTLRIETLLQPTTIGFVKLLQVTPTKDPIDKNTCVRTLFSDGHNIDEPIYYKKGDTPELALIKRDGWIESDPKLFTDWFNDLAEKSTT